MDGITCPILFPTLFIQNCFPLYPLQITLCRCISLPLIVNACIASVIQARDEFSNRVTTYFRYSFHSIGDCFDGYDNSFLRHREFLNIIRFRAPVDALPDPVFI